MDKLSPFDVKVLKELSKYPDGVNIQFLNKHFARDMETCYATLKNKNMLRQIKSTFQTLIELELIIFLEQASGISLIRAKTF